MLFMHNLAYFPVKTCLILVFGNVFDISNLKYTTESIVVVIEFYFV
jgi:hypothetical protein